MPRSMAVGLFAAVGATMSALVAFTDHRLVWVTIAVAAVATGLAAYLAVMPAQPSIQPLCEPVAKLSVELQIKKKLSGSGSTSGPLTPACMTTTGREDSSAAVLSLSCA
jgi:hypothetical protein